MYDRKYEYLVEWNHGSGRRGCPVQFETRDEVARHPVTGMRGYGTFHLPEGSWTYDSSLTIALLESIRRVKKIDPDDIMGNFMKWLYDGAFTPYGQSYDIGRGTRQAIDRYRRNRKAEKCGGDEEWNNGNGSLMRIMPACIYCSERMTRGFSFYEAYLTDKENLHHYDRARDLTV